MRVLQITLLAGLAFTLTACARQQTETDTGDVQPGAADTTAGILDTAAADTSVLPGDRVMPADPGAARDTAMLGDTTGAMDDTAMTQMGDTVTTQVDDPAATQTGDTAPAQMSDTTGAADDPTGTMSDSAMMQMGDTATRGRQVEIGTIIACGLLTGASTSSRPLADCVVRPHIQRMIRHGAIVQFYFSGFWGIPAGGRRLVHTRR